MNDDLEGLGIGLMVIALIFVPAILITTAITIINKPTEIIYIKSNEGVIMDINSWEIIEEVGFFIEKETVFHNITIEDELINESVSLIFKNIDELDNALVGDHLILYLNLGYDIEDGWYILNIIRNGTLIINVG